MLLISIVADVLLCSGSAAAPLGSLAPTCSNKLLLLLFCFLLMLTVVVVLIIWWLLLMLPIDVTNAALEYLYDIFTEATDVRKKFQFSFSAVCLLNYFSSSLMF